MIFELRSYLFRPGGLVQYLAAAQERNVPLTDPEAREIVYGMPYEEWKKKYQKEATPEQKKAFAETHKH